MISLITFLRSLLELASQLLHKGMKIAVLAPSLIPFPCNHAYRITLGSEGLAPSLQHQHHELR